MYRIYLSLLFSSIAIGFACILKGKKYSHLWLLPFLSILIYAVEEFAQHLSNQYIPNFWVYNYYSAFEAFFYTWLISTTFVQKKARLISSQINILVLIISLINIIFFQGTTSFHTITFGVGSIQIIINCIYYFYQIFIFPSKEELFAQAFFWIITAILFQFVCGFPIFMLNNIYYTKVASSIWPIIGVIIECINIIFQLLIIIAFVCKIKKF